MWPPADATLGQLEEWLDALRRLPEDDVILGRQTLLGRRIEELRRPLPAQPAEPLTLVLRAKRLSDKRRRQLSRFSGLLDELLAQEVALKAALMDAHATVDTTRRLLTLAEEDEHRCFREYAATLSAPGRADSPGAAEEASAVSARRSGSDAAAAQGVCGLITQLLMLPAAAEASNLGDAHAALLRQARLVHEGLTGNAGPTLVPDQEEPAGAPGGRCVPPRMSWVAGTGPDPPAMPMPHAAPALPGAGLSSVAGPPVAHGGYAAPGPSGSASVSADAAGHAARARSTSRSASRARSAVAASAASSRSEERERSPRGVSAIAAALAAAVADAEADDDGADGDDAGIHDAHPVSTDEYMPAADAGAVLPDAHAGPRATTLHPQRPVTSAAWGSLGSVDELRVIANAAAAVLRQCITPGPDQDAARAAAETASANLAEAKAVLIAAMEAGLVSLADPPARTVPLVVAPVSKAPSAAAPAGPGRMLCA